MILISKYPSFRKEGLCLMHQASFQSIGIYVHLIPKSTMDINPYYTYGK